MTLGLGFDGVFQLVSATPRGVTELQRLVECISQRVGRHLERRGVLVRDAENVWLDFEAEQISPLDDLAGHSITYRIAVGPNQGRKAFTVQTLPAWESDEDGHSNLATAAGFSLHAGVAAGANERDKIERLCRYIARPALARSCLSLTEDAQVCYAFKTPWRDGTTHVVLEPLDFIAKLAALIPRPGVNLTRHHGVFAPNSPLRALITPGRRGKENKKDQRPTQSTPSAPARARRDELTREHWVTWWTSCISTSLHDIATTPPGPARCGVLVQESLTRKTARAI